MELNSLLSYPLDHGLILRKKKKIKNELLKQTNFLKKKIAILGGSTTTALKDAIELFLLNQGILPTFFESEYNKYYEDIMFENQDLYDFKPDIIYIFTTFKNIKIFPKANDSIENIEDMLKNELNQYLQMWDKINTNLGSMIIQNNFELPLVRVLGNLDFSANQGKINYIQRLNLFFADHSRSNKNLLINDINYLSGLIGLERWFDHQLWFSYKYAMGFQGVVETAYSAASIIKSIYGKSKKCLVLDLDNTLWGGVIGDDGVDNIKIGNETAVAESYLSIQKYAKQLKDRGVILAVASKNEEDIAKQGFSHPDSLLAYTDFASFKANWQPKNNNLEQIAGEINIGLDSLVFVDDNPVERDLVRNSLSSVSVPDVGSDQTKYISYIDRNYYFESIEISAEDIQRNKYYSENLERNNLKSNFSDYGEFLKTLEMSAEISGFKSVYLDRITQLTNKTNQFNLTTRRYSFKNIKQISLNDEYICIYAKLKDKYGDNGLVSVVIGKIKDTELHIDLWLMSCRVLKRDLEFAVLKELVQLSIKKGLTSIFGYYYPTKKNKMVENLYLDFGFKLISESDNYIKYKIDLVDFVSKDFYIKVN